MDREKIKLIVRNMESLVEILKSEVYSKEDSYSFDEIRNSPPISDYDEIFNEDD